MPTSFGAGIKIDGSLNAAVNAKPNVGSKFWQKLPVPWSPDWYESAVTGLLQTLSGSDTGKAVMAQLTRPLTIRPFIWRPENAFAAPVAFLHGTELDKSLDCGKSASQVKGTGNGTPVTIWITPANRHIPDASLLHEMVHAMRLMQGARTCFEYANNFGTEEEYFAILVVNIFMSELSRRQIRVDHGVKSWVDATAPWEQFRVDPFLITQFGMRHASLAMDLGRVRKAKFNPFNPAFSDRVQVGFN